MKPKKDYTRLAAQIQAVTDLLPYYSQAVNAQAVPKAQTDLAASEVTSRGMAQLQADLYNQYGPLMNAIGNRILDENALASANRDKAVLAGPGKDLVQQAYDLSQIYDKPYYDTRAATASRIQDLLSSIDLSGGLSDVERREIEQGLAREGLQRGTLNSPSQTDTVSNAMRYGNAGFNRQQTAKSNLAAAIQSASAFLPNAKSGVDVFQVATGKPSQNNPGNNLFTGAQNTENAGNYGLAQNLLGGALQNRQMQQQSDFNKKDWLDKFVQFSQGMSNVTSSIGNIAGMAI